MRSTRSVALSVALLMAGLAAPAVAADRSVNVSVGYSFLKILEEGGFSYPLGAYLSVSKAGARVGPELDLAYHRKSEEGIALNTFTGLAGVRFAPGADSGEVKPFVHLLAGARHDRVLGESNTALGGMAGGGVDIKAGVGARLRLGADFQLFHDEGESLKALRLSIGVSF